MKMRNSRMENMLTPCFIFDEMEFERGVEGFGRALRTKFVEVGIGYSVKTNSLTYVMREAHRLGCYAEVVSNDEYQLARGCGFDPSDIIYNGPMKSKETFIEAMNGGAIVNLETKRELEWLEELDKDKKYNVGIRLNINVSKVSREDAEGDDDNSRFGFSVESGEFAWALNQIQNMPHIRLAGLHIHRTTLSRLPRFYERSVEFAAEVINSYGLTLDYLDVGGGFYGISRNKPAFKDYVEGIYRLLKRYGIERLRIIVEPGNALVSKCFSFLTEVIDTKRVDRDTVFVTTDGSRIDIDPIFRRNSYIKELIYADSNRDILPLQIVSGCTCLEFDRLFNLKESPRLEVGDRIKYSSVGAYTMTLSPQFIRLFPRVYAVDTLGNFKEVRRPSTAEDLLNLEIKQ